MAGATSHHWERWSGSIPPSATGVDTNTLTISNPRPNDAGDYRCVATNGYDKVMSDYATLTIIGE